MKITRAQSDKIAKKLGINLEVLNPEYFNYAMNVETEHKDVTHGNLLTTGLIAHAHIMEFPDYYIRIKKMEAQAKKYWSKRQKPNIML
jgi:hypothetical protein